MIARIWTGKTDAANSVEYSKFLEQTAVKDYQSVTGNLGLHFLRKTGGEEAIFILITYWDSIDSIKHFAGDDYEKAKYYSEDSDFLLSFPEKVEHFEVFVSNDPGH